MLAAQANAAVDAAESEGRRVWAILPHDKRYIAWWYFTMAIAIITAALDPFKTAFVDSAGL